MMQPDLFTWTPPIFFGDRDGETFSPPRDRKRLNRQAQDIFDLIHDGEWRTLTQISNATNHPEASVSARLRDFRKVRFGGYDIQRRFVSRGLFEYRLGDS